MQDEGHDPLNLPQSNRGLEGVCTLPFATLCGRGQQGLVKDVAVMSGCSFGYCPVALALSLRAFQLCGELHATRRTARKVSYQTGGYSWETPIFHCMAAEWDR